MEAKEIKTQQDAERYVEGVINDFEAGISTKKETVKYLFEYTCRLHDLFFENTKKKIIAEIQKFKV